MLKVEDVQMETLIPGSLTPLYSPCQGENLFYLVELHLFAEIFRPLGGI